MEILYVLAGFPRTNPWLCDRLSGMPVKDSHGGQSVRRSFLRNLVGLGTIGAVGSLAGCTGSDGGDGGGDGDGGDGSGGDGGDDGSDGGDGGGQVTQAPELIDVSAAIPPLGHYVTMFDHFQEEGLYDQILTEHGVGNFDVRRTWEDVPLFASGQVDIGFPGVTAAATLAVEQDLNLTITGSVLNQWQGLQVKAGGEYDLFPDADSRFTNEQEKQIIDKVKADGDPSANVGIGTWSGGSVDIMQWQWPRVYGYEFTEDNWNVVTASYPQQPQLLDRGRVKVAQSTPVAGAADDIVDGKLVAVHYHFQWLEDMGQPKPPLNNIVARDSFVEENPSVMVGITELINEGLAWIHENADDIKEREDQQEAWGYDGRQDAVRLTYDYITGSMRENWEGEIHPSHITDLPALPSDGTLTDDLIAEEKEVTNIFVEEGHVPEGWEDRITYRKHTDL